MDSTFGEIYQLSNPFNEQFSFTWDSANGGPTITLEPLGKKLLPKGLAEYGAMKMAHRLVQSKHGYGATLKKDLMTETIQKLLNRVTAEDVQSSSVEQQIEELNKEEEVKEVEPVVEEEAGFEGVNEDMEDYDEEKERKTLLKENNPRAFRAEELDEEYSRNDLVKMAKGMGIELHAKSKKDEIIQLILDAEK